MNRCPYCAIVAPGLSALAAHIEDMHPGREHDTLIVTTADVLPLVGAMPVGEPMRQFPGVDIDAVHRTYGKAVAA